MATLEHDRTEQDEPSGRQGTAAKLERLRALREQALLGGGERRIAQQHARN